MTSEGIVNTYRISRGRDINAACGQLINLNRNDTLSGGIYDADQLQKTMEKEAKRRLINNSVMDAYFSAKVAAAERLVGMSEFWHNGLRTLNGFIMTFKIMFF